MMDATAVGDWDRGVHWHEFLIASGDRLQTLDVILGRRRRVVAAVERLQGRGDELWVTVAMGPIAAAVRVQG